MKAVWYERNGHADILEYGEMPDPEPGPGEVRVRVISSGVNPSDWKRRQGLTSPIEFPRVVPNQDGAGVIDAVGPGVPQSRIGERVWLFESQFGRPFGTGAEYTVQPAGHASGTSSSKSKLIDTSHGGGMGGTLAIEQMQIMDQSFFWSWPIFLGGTALAWGIMAIQN